VVIDDFLHVELANGLLSEFPAIEMMPKSRDYAFGNKHELSSVGAAGHFSQTYCEAVTGEEFQNFLRQLTNRDVFVDPQFHGGGFHQGADGSFLDMHVDFNIHPINKDWHRIVNCLLYLNKDWDHSFGGELLIKSTPESDPIGIEPTFNRAVIMVTNESTYHGFRKMDLPLGVTRKSIATYAYELVDPKSIVAHTTGWKPESASPLKSFMATHYNTAVKVKNRVLGSGTAKNR
jgi:hypothetical protein